jgi:hypothetical protein
MDAVAQDSTATQYECEDSALAPRPRTLADIGVSVTFMAELASKHLLTAGVLSLKQLADRLAMPGRLLEDVLHFLRQESRVQVLAADADTGALRFALTDRGRVVATDAMAVSGYVGPVPVPLADYVRVVQAQSVHANPVTRDDMRMAFRDVVVSDDLLDRIGPSLSSGRALFVYGPPGTGKTHLTQRMARVFRSTVLIPHAVAINDAVVAVFDPVIHKTIARSAKASLSLDGSFDERFVRCERPAIVVGGELTGDMLEVQYDHANREYRAPLQLKANNGLFIIDDMGRQRIEPQAIFNRWIVPLEEKRDYLSLGSGRHFSVPFDVVLVFSTNMQPRELADEAFLRRIGYKIRFPYLNAEQYAGLWRTQCRQMGVPVDEEILDYLVRVLHRRHDVPLLPCHPRDLLGLCVDRTTYAGEPRVVTKAVLDWAWQNYFASTDETTDTTAQIGEWQ